VPTLARFDNSEQAAYITFDKGLAALGSFNASTFTIHQPSRWYQTGIVTLAGGVGSNQVRVPGISPTVIAGPASIDYSDSLATLVGVNGLPVHSFAGFPCPPTP
jgi:hypothetical protein